ncbi:CDP-glycerol glycerophosphotransferase family protein [Nocardioides iriomotensis]|uniref:CDP-glycerol--glycerophosphate glycerophosphotransferase n=1 Tax=Nocardioides iriomotensis TaxID=715784 RepID=A0A4Q5IV98_9ACTN|nr:CDP-glycerol glycerophosphotransferase family protein [Nocardioides iriomotensis]RYU09930.1 CDP-glycerol--glycerophosphate glycerophosphotransferase [Nocardioides iriomotensis]
MPKVSVLAYFADDVSRTYQLIQWLPVLELLHAEHPVGVVARDLDSAAVLQGRTSLPVLVAPSFPALHDLYDDVDPKVVLYCNNSILNFQSLLHGRALHVHVNHGESDKQSMASNNAKAYDRVFVAGEAAVQRHVAGLLEFDTSRLVRIGRPQLDLSRTSPLPEAADGRRTVLYAPTWEGDADYNNYTSLDTVGRGVVRAILDVPGVRLVYKPHPKIATSQTPSIRDAHRDVLDLVADAAARDPEAGHTVYVTGDILALMPSCDAMVTDVSSVGLDWLYLCTGKPLFVTDRHLDGERLRQEVPVSRCADVIEHVDGVAGETALTALVEARLDHDEHHLARVAMRHHYFDDYQVGDSTLRFKTEVAELVALRDRLVGETGGDETSAAIIA